MVLPLERQALVQGPDGHVWPVSPKALFEAMQAGYVILYIPEECEEEAASQGLRGVQLTQEQLMAAFEAASFNRDRQYAHQRQAMVGHAAG